MEVRAAIENATKHDLTESASTIVTGTGTSGSMIFGQKPEYARMDCETRVEPISSERVTDKDVDAAEAMKTGLEIVESGEMP